jgi:hypothetical protein
MKRVIVENENRDVVKLSDLPEEAPIFAKKNGKLRGMVVKEVGKSGWILRLGGLLGATGYHASRYECLKSAAAHGYKFFIEDEDKP